MKKQLTIAVIAGLVLMTTAIMQGQSDQSAGAAQENAEKALRILESACDHLARAKTVRVTSEGSYDQISPEGIRMELSARRTTTLQRPDRLLVDPQGDAGSRVVVFDRGHLGILSRSQKLYGEADLAPTLDEAIEQLATEYGMVLPTADLLLTDPFDALTGDVLLAAHLGEHAALGKPCDHLAFQTENVDFQVWVEKAEPRVIRKLVIAFKNEPGVPQFRASFHQWEFGVQSDASAFTFQPPDDYTKVDFEPESDASNDDSDEN